MQADAYHPPFVAKTIQEHMCMLDLSQWNIVVAAKYEAF